MEIDDLRVILYTGPKWRDLLSESFYLLSESFYIQVQNGGIFLFTFRVILYTGPKWTDLDFINRLDGGLLDKLSEKFRDFDKKSREELHALVESFQKKLDALLISGERN